MYVFNHIPKTAGVSCYRLLQQLVGADQVSPHFNLDQEIAYQISPSDYDKYFVIYGHIGVGWNDIIGPGRKWMTMLRDPVDRVLSQYYYWRHRVPCSPHLPHVNAAQTLQLDEFIRSQHYMVLQGNENCQTWFLADDLRIRFRTVVPGDALDLAKRNLKDRFAFIGITEDFRSSTNRLCKLLNVAVPESLPVENQTVERPALQDIKPGTLDAIRELNVMDQALYEYGKQLVQGD